MLQTVLSTLKKITLKGRADKKEYTAFFVFNIIFSVFSFIFFLLPVFVLLYKVAALYGNAGLQDIPVNLKTIGIYCLIVSVFFIPASIWLTIAQFCLAIRRTHDFNLSGWYYFAFYVLINILCGVKDSSNICVLIAGILSIAQVIIYCCVKGTDGLNNFSSEEERYLAESNQ